MSTLRWSLIVSLTLALWSCGGKNGASNGQPQCSDGIDNDGDGLIDFPDDPGCTSPDDDSEDSLPSPQCSDGRDNDGDGKIDYPDDPGCFSPNTDSETDDCPSGPNCPQCSNGIDDDGNGLIDYPADPGCSSAADSTEFSSNSDACGAGMVIKELPANGMDTDMLVTSSTSSITSPCGGGSGAPAFAYLLDLQKNQVVVASTDDPATQTDTILDIRSMACTSDASELACDDDVNAALGNTNSTVTKALPAGLYYLIVTTKDLGSDGTYALKVQMFDGVGVVCTDSSTCGPGLFCNPATGGGSGMVCSLPQCSDGIDNDGDGKIDFPNDPGCATPNGNDETDDCPNGPNCPECSNGKDDDHDGETDYPADTTCKSAGGLSEACETVDPVMELAMPMTAGDTTASHNDFELTCAFDTGAPDDIYRLDLPATTSLDIEVSAAFFDDLELLPAACTGTALTCTSDSITETNFAAGTYYLVVDGDSPSDLGTYTITVTGKIKNGASCESPLAQSGALTCGPGFACKGTAGARVCAKAQCSDGIDNDGDGRIDYPNDPGCDSPEDDDESDTCTLATGVGCPECSDKIDNDGDGLVDFPADFGCASAAGTSEVFCPLETDLPITKITTAATSGTTAGKHDDITPSCTFGSTGGLDVTFALLLPVPVVTLVIDTLGSSYDTVLEVNDTTCMNELACNDDGPTDSTSQITMTDVAAGNYAVTVDGFDDTTNGTFKLNVKGTVAKNTACTSPLFAANVLKCPAGTTCTTGTCH